MPRKVGTVGRMSPSITPESGPAIHSIKDLTRLIQHAEGFAQILAALKTGRGATVDGAWGSACPLVVASLGSHAPKTILIVLAHVGDVDDFRDDVATFSGIVPDIFPAWERSQREIDARDEIQGARLRVLKKLARGEAPRFIVAPFQALMQPVPKPELVARLSRTIAVGDTLDLDELSRWLVDRGMTRVEVVEVAGEFSIRGGIVDVFAPDSAEPTRIELFGDEIESIRAFDPETQRSHDRLRSIGLTIIPPLDPTKPDQLAHLCDYLPEETWSALVEPVDLKQEGSRYLARVDDPTGLTNVESTFAKLIRYPSVALSTIAGASLETTCRLRIESVERFSGDLAKVKNELETTAVNDHVVILCHNEAESERLRDVFGDMKLSTEGRLTLLVGRIRSGFRLVESRLAVIGDHELFARPDVRRPTTKRRYETRAIDSFLDLNEGDLVVHLSHGIAVYRGLQMVDKADDHIEETLLLEFAGGARMFVPIAKVNLVQKYVGGGKANPQLSKLGTSTWEKRKKRVAEAVLDLASELIDIQAARETKPGIAYPVDDSRWTAEFEAAFPYQETPDQLRAIESVKADMSKSRPMDRLICGDVGYGKTEVAIRAAFKAIDAGKQVAVLVPTTILAEQHHRSFSARMAEFPFVIETINRFRPKSEVRDVLKRASEGKVDILIGTHRIVQKDVSFRDLGLVIIDEEQRFGVEDKEWLKSLRTTVDVLTLSATPIPRTLHMSLIGLRDISNLETPPPDRKAIETRISRFDPILIRDAIYRELNRDGQVYFVHNRVHDIESVADRIKAIVPEARIAIAHGQMAGDALERTMLSFIRHEADILLATTIIESGLDIPNVNTIIINDADRHGLADLHQLRGRVGRYKHRAYAYLLLDPDRTISENAVKRLKAIEEFTELGAGFKIALRDLEIRGAGNILGSEQSGHIEAVGYELYCSLLESAVGALLNKPGRAETDCTVELAWRAYLPRDYVSGHRLKVELYRRLGRIRTIEHLADFRQELIDRFGPPPLPAENLLRENELRVLAGRWRIVRIHVEDDYAVLTYQSKERIGRLAKIHPGMVRIADDKTAYVPLEEKRPKASIIVELVKSILDVKT